MNLKSISSPKMPLDNDPLWIVGEYLYFYEILKLQSVSKQFQNIFSKKVWAPKFNEKDIAKEFGIYKKEIAPVDKEGNKILIPRKREDNCLGKLLRIWIDGMEGSLKTLNLSINLTSKDIEYFSAMLTNFSTRQIISINLSSEKNDYSISSKAIRTLLEVCKNVTDLNLFGRVEFENSNFGFKKKLKSLDLSNCSKFTIKALKEIIYQTPNLTSLSVSGCQELNWEVLINIKKLKNLTSLDIRYCKKVNNNSIHLLNKNLKSLCITKNWYLDNTKIRKAINKNSLDFLNLNYLGEKIEAPLINAILKKQEKLTCLQVCAEIDTIGVETLKNHKNLKNIYLSNTDISRNALEQVSTNPNLEKINLYKCTFDFEINKIKIKDYSLSESNLNHFEFHRK